MIGQNLCQYTIEDKIGAGGMGVVYRAFDTRLLRKVAIKVLNAAQGTGSDRRLLDEARSASALNHPNICTIYELGQTSEYAFISMEYIEGKVLRDIIPLGGLPPQTVVRFGVQVADAIAHAHQRRIIHRDLKSANIIVVEDDRVKVLDFGLAVRQIPSEEDETRGPSKVGADVLAGTLFYLSPEVLRGQPAGVDSDCWSLGVLLYEMCVGHVPFRGVTEYEISGAILHDALPPIPAQVPNGLRNLIVKALSKDPVSRFSSAEEIRKALEGADSPEIVTSVAPVARPSVLVLPFENMSASPEDDYFSDGLTDEIITDLSGVRGLRVISRTSSMRFKGMAENIDKIAKDLNVQFVLEGSIRRMGAQLRMTAKLIDTLTDSPVWAGKYSGTLEDVFAIQEQVSKSIVSSLKVRITPEEALHLVERPITDIRAYEAYLRAKREMLKYTREALDKAVEYVQASIAIEGETILLLTALGEIHWQYVNAGISADPMHLDSAEACAGKILGRDARSHHGLRLDGLVRVHRGDFQGSVTQLKMSLEGDPNDSDTLLWLSVVACLFGKTEEAQVWVTRLLEIDPLTPFYQMLPGLLLQMAGAFNESVVSFGKVYNANLDNPVARLLYGQALLMDGKRDAACEVFDALAKDIPESPFASLGSFFRLAAQGHSDAALKMVTPELETSMGVDPQYSWMMAECFSLARATDQAIEWLERAVNRGFINYPMLEIHDPLLASLRSDPRFQSLMHDVENRWKAFVL